MSIAATTLLVASGVRRAWVIFPQKSGRHSDLFACAEMVSPDDLVQACKTFDTIGVPFRTRSLRSGVTVLESGMYLPIVPTNGICVVN